MKLANTNRFYLPGTNNQYLHLATIHHGVREFICFAHVSSTQVYIEEITGGSLSFIEDNKLAEALNEFLVSQQVLVMNRPLLSDNEWLRNKRTSP